VLPCAGIEAAAQLDGDALVVVVTVGLEEAAPAIADPPSARAATPAAPTTIFFIGVNMSMVVLSIRPGLVPGSAPTVLVLARKVLGRPFGSDAKTAGYRPRRDRAFTSRSCRYA